MNAPVRTPPSTSVVQRTVVALALTLVALIGLLFALPGGARAAKPASPTASTAATKSRFDRLSINAVHGGVLVRGSVLPGSKHSNAKVSLLLRQGTRGRVRRAETVQLGRSDRNFALLDHLAPGRWGVKVRFTDPGHATETASSFTEITVPAMIGFPLTPGSLQVSNGSVTYSGSIPHPKNTTQVELLGLDTGPVEGAKGPFHTAPSAFNVLATTTVGPGTAGAMGFRLQAKVKQGERWTFVLKRTFHHVGIDYAGLRTVGVR